ncbi:hypothetical protein CYLTODRAFT_363997 [Cylindrobasidium torrendii FP15055 ss-10]|uniref:Proteophosphoglycan ppg4 n=1 Tax=Cylindrobasidium torrendii FP15055 ss-10 TaxID=1314674 RepID=A0A0D7BV74_9AGAR|nr:hypothetical protein CYLTODRAFT_363997 [Cylindrobasidium torrendii FP15055 ss-10]
MSISFGGLGLMSFRNPFADVTGALWGKGDIRSMFWLIVFSIVCLVMAYLTNPSETSFRTFLTEQSFRHHLRRLDDNLDDQELESHISPANRKPANVVLTPSFDNRSPFHFANRASVSLRTPKHVFHSFGIFTIAAIIPVTKPERIASKALENSSVICDSWYVGAFGRWWRGGVLEAWYQDVFARTSDEESWSSGILGMKTTERSNECSGLPFSTKNLPPHLLSRGSPPRLRNREKSSQRSSGRSSTPPPLPKSASLPLHATRTAGEQLPIAPPLPHSKQVYADSLSSGLPGHAYVGFDQSPVVVELLQQVSTSKSSILDLRNQLNDFRQGAAQTHAALMEELEECREKKRQEDTGRNELKTKTKTLDDSKRQAEAQKRDVEKRLRSAASRRDDMRHRIKDVDSEILRLQRNLKTPPATPSDAESPDHELQAALMAKREEITVAEGAVTTLTARTKDLEDRLAAQKERLRTIRERSQNLETHSAPLYPSDASAGNWPPSETHSRDDSNISLPDFADAGFLPTVTQRVRSTSSDASSHPSNMSVGAANHSPVGTRDLGTVPLDIPKAINFSPFADLDQPPIALSPTAANLIPAGLMSSLALDSTDAISSSFRSESDMFLDRHWRTDHSLVSPPRRRQTSSDEDLTLSSPSSLHGPVGGSDTEYDPFEVRMPLDHERERLSSMDMQRASFLPRNPSFSVTPANFSDDEIIDGKDKSPSGRRWFHSSPKQKKGLNPDAKAFTFWKGRLSANSGHTATMSFDALNPHGISHHNLTATTADSSTLLRAFAPSPEEREVLQRALGSSTNASLERLPSLSEAIPSIPPSPSHVHAQSDLSGISTADKIPSWLQTLSWGRKPQPAVFSPWDPEEETLVEKSV